MYHRLPFLSVQIPFHAGGRRQWVDWSWMEYTMRKHRPGCGENAVTRSPGSGIRAGSARLIYPGCPAAGT